MIVCRARPALVAMFGVGLLGVACSSAELGQVSSSPPATFDVGVLPSQPPPVAPAQVAPSPVAQAQVAPSPGSEVAAVPPDSAAQPTAASRRFTISVSGDTLMHRPLVNRAREYAGGVGHDFSPMFARIAPLVMAADLAICHLETPVAPTGEELSTFPYYGVPAEVAGGLASAGYDRCSTASNHTFDRGVAGIEATIDALTAAGIAQSGMESDPNATLPAPFVVNGVTVAHLSYTFSYNGIHVPDEHLWRSHLIDTAHMVADAAAVRAAGAEYVIVSVHAGSEGSATPNEQQRAVAEALTASGLVDLVVGHHAHVLQPIEQINGHWVLFGLGNLISNLPTGPDWPRSSQDGAIVTITVGPGADGALVTGQPVVAPTWVEHGDYVIRSVLDDLADPSIVGGLREELEQSLARSTKVLANFIPGVPAAPSVSTG